MKQYISIIIFLALAQTAFAQSEVTLKEESVVMPTYPVAPAEKSPIFFRNEAYQGASRHYYPLTMNDQYTHERIEKAWKMVVLENDYIELGISPEMGGKIYYATDKTNDYHFIYKNNVVKPSNIGMTGAWVSGGIEWSIPHHHRASTFLPSDYTTSINSDGSKTIWVGEYEPRHGMRWTIGVTMFPGKSFFKVEGRMYNPTPYTHTFLYWANVATHTNINYQTIFPPSAQIVTFHSKTDFTRWPVSTENFRGSDFTEGVDISWWKNTKKSNSFFVHDLQEDFMGGYDHGKNAGTVHVGNHNIVKGAKLWQWGSGPRGQATEARLTEDDVDWIVFRTGEMYLNAAEAAFENGEADEAKRLINIIRDRVGMPPKENLTIVEVRNERFVELYIEEHRYWDIRRWRIAVDELNGKGFKGVTWEYHIAEDKYGIKIKDADFNQIRVFAERNYYFPIGLNRIADNPNLVKNPGY